MPLLVLKIAKTRIDIATMTADAVVPYIIGVKGCSGDGTTGAEEGKRVGDGVGFLEGALVGNSVGNLVGKLVGNFVGDLVGNSVGLSEGLKVGNFVGASVESPGSSKQVFLHTKGYSLEQGVYFQKPSPLCPSTSIL